MADQGRWFKLWVSAVSDPDLANLSLEDFGRWCIFGAYLKLHGEDGRLSIKSPAQALQILFRVPSFDGVVKVLESFPNCHLRVSGVTAPTSLHSEALIRVEWSNWQKYQIDDSADRVRKWREKKRAAVTGDSVSPVTPIEEKRSRRDEKRRDETRREVKKSQQHPSAPDGAAPTNPAWHGYCEAYRLRYGTDPVRNAKVNGQLKTLLSRIPSAEAPDVAAFYVGHNGSFYVRAGHSIDLLVRDAEKLHTEWVTGRRVTESGARAGDQREERGTVAKKLLDKAERQRQGEIDA